MPAKEGQKKGLQEQIRDAAIDVRNEAIVQSANLYLTARRVLLASLGALALTIEEGNEFIDKLVERGEVAETDMQKLLNDIRKRSDEREANVADLRRNGVEKAGIALADSVEVILERLNVPTKGDIEQLSQKIGQLNEKVMALRRRANGQ